MKFRLALLVSTLSLAVLHATTVTTTGMTSDGVVYATGSATVLSTSAGGTNTVLIGNGSSSAPSFSGTPQLTGIGLGAAGSTTTPLIVVPTATTTTSEVNTVKVDLASAPTNLAFTASIANQRAVYVTVPTYTASSSQTITTAATFDVAGPPIASGSLTITNPYAVRVEVGQNLLADTPSSAVWSPGGGPYTNYASTKATIGGVFSGLEVVLAHVGAVQGTTLVPSTAGAAVVGLGGSFYAQSAKSGGYVIGLFGSGQSGAITQDIYGANTIAGDCNYKDCNPSYSGYASYGAKRVVSIEADTTVTNTGTQFSANFLSEKLAFTTSQAGSVGAPLDYAFLVGKDTNSASAPTCSGTGCGTDPTVMSNLVYTGNVTTNYCVLAESGTTFRWGFFFSVNCTSTASDLAVNAVTNTEVSSSTHIFTNGDVGTSLQVTAGAGWTAGTYTINSVNASPNYATLSASPAAAGTTGGTYALWEQIGQSFTTSPFYLVMPVDTSTVCIAAPAQPVSCLQGSEIRPIATSYGLTVTFGAASGYTANDYWTLPVVGVPPTHAAFATEPGSADYFAIILPVNAGQSQPSQSIQFNSLNSSASYLTSTLNLDQSGNFTLNPPATGAVLVSGPLNTTGAIDVNSSFKITTAGTVSQYFGTALALHGLPASVGVANTTSTSGNGSGTPVASTITSSASEYRINYYLYQTVAGVACSIDASVLLDLNFTDVNSIARTASETLMMGNSNTPFLSGSLPIVSAANSAISYTSTYTAGTGCTTAPKYAVYVWVEAM
ncbi:MAG: hypothetical protein ABSB86_14700 [Bryobacteraceae bacterium]